MAVGIGSNMSNLKGPEGPFEAAFKGGVYVSAGDVTGDGIAKNDLRSIMGEGSVARVVA